MRAISRRRKAAAAAASVVVVLATTAVIATLAGAAIPDSMGVYHACYDK
jgi:hypothetical protein